MTFKNLFTCTLTRDCRGRQSARVAGVSVARLGKGGRKAQLRLHYAPPLLVYEVVLRDKRVDMKLVQAT